MDDSREESPDWVRTFQAPTHSLAILSSDSEFHSYEEASPSNDGSSSSPSSAKVDYVTIAEEAEREREKNSHSKRVQSGRKVVCSYKRKKLEGNGVDKDEEDSKKDTGSNHSFQEISSDSDNDRSHKQSKVLQGKRIKDNEDSPCKSLKSLPKEAAKEEPSSHGLDIDNPIVEDEKKDIDVRMSEDCTHDILEKQTGSRVQISNRLPLVLSEKIHRSKALVECEGDSIDLSGDMGAVGRIVISDTPSGDQEMHFDLKGTVYKTSIVPCRTFCIVSFGQSEAKIEAIMDDFLQLKPLSSVYEAETMVEGTLEGFSFESDDEADKTTKGLPHQTDQGNQEDKVNGKRRAPVGKSTGPKKKAVAGGAKPRPAKKGKKKAPVSKKTRTKK